MNFFHGGSPFASASSTPPVRLELDERDCAGTCGRSTALGLRPLRPAEPSIAAARAIKRKIFSRSPTIFSSREPTVALDCRRSRVQKAKLALKG
jgi:hypothetical protein